MPERDVIDDLAYVAVPEPRHGEVDPPENFAAACARRDRLREEYAATLRTLVKDSGADPLLTALRRAAEQRDLAEREVRALISYGRHFTGARPDYTWEALAAAAGLPYSTARKAVSSDDVDAVHDALAAAARPERPLDAASETLASLEVHRAHSELLALGVDDAPEGLHPDEERDWWINRAEQLWHSDLKLARQISIRAHHWHNRWVRFVHPRGRSYADLAEKLRTMSSSVTHWDPAQRHVPREADQLDELIRALKEIRVGLA